MRNANYFVLMGLSYRISSDVIGRRILRDAVFSGVDFCRRKANEGATALFEEKDLDPISFDIAWRSWTPFMQVVGMFMDIGRGFTAWSPGLAKVFGLRGIATAPTLRADAD
ncbi:hypothetical protein ACH347_23685 [Saccharopolyspora sp. 5N102]|uniref:hypothetical protein n=1 Tax=Saccharopolyspora sp. 5N102 TaxID=3375155 RepID=UPI0037A5979B